LTRRGREGNKRGNWNPRRGGGDGEEERGTRGEIGIRGEAEETAERERERAEDEGEEERPLDREGEAYSREEAVEEEGEEERPRDREGEAYSREEAVEDVPPGCAHEQAPLRSLQAGVQMQRHAST
jgi:hypothetical protein